MSLTSDLVGIIKCQFDKAGIRYEDDMDVCDLVLCNINNTSHFPKDLISFGA